MLLLIFCLCNSVFNKFLTFLNRMWHFPNAVLRDSLGWECACGRACHSPMATCEAIPAGFGEKSTGYKILQDPPGIFSGSFDGNKAACICQYCQLVGACTQKVSDSSSHHSVSRKGPAVNAEIITWSVSFVESPLFLKTFPKIYPNFTISNIKKPSLEKGI